MTIEAESIVMKVTKRAMIISLIALSMVLGSAISGLTSSESLVNSLIEEMLIEFPIKKFLVGIGEVTKSQDVSKDKNKAKVMARLEITRQIRARILEKATEWKGEGKAASLGKDEEEYQNEFIGFIEKALNYFSDRSQIVKYGERNGLVYAVAILRRDQAGAELGKMIEDSLDQARKDLNKAKEGDKASFSKAKEEYTRAKALEKIREILEGARGGTFYAFEGLEREIINLQEKEKYH